MEQVQERGYYSVRQKRKAEKEDHDTTCSVHRVNNLYITRSGACFGQMQQKPRHHSAG